MVATTAASALRISNGLFDFKSATRIASPIFSSVISCSIMDGRFFISPFTLNDRRIDFKVPPLRIPRAFPVHTTGTFIVTSFPGVT